MLIEPFARPRIKPEHRGYRTVSGDVRIGSVVYGVGAEIEDPDGWIWTLVEAADGTRDTDRLLGHVCSRHPGLELADVASALRQLISAGFVEDAGASQPPAISQREAERYGRGIALMRWMDLSPRASSWDVQLRLKESEVLVLGVGGTGGLAAQQLVASGVGRMHCIDEDVVELSNLNRQLLYSESDLGRAKAEAAEQRLRSLNSDVHVTSEVRRIGSRSELDRLLDRVRPYDLMILGADQPPGMRRWVNQACSAAGVPWAEGGYRGPLVTAGIFHPKTGTCWECLHDGAGMQADLGLEPGADEELASPHLPWNPVNAVTASLSGSLVAYGALSLLTGVPKLEPGFRFGFNLMRPSDEVYLRLPPRPDCPTCGAH